VVTQRPDVLVIIDSPDFTTGLRRVRAAARAYSDRRLRVSDRLGVATGARARAMRALR
jgi:hypothetical protein